MLSEKFKEQIIKTYMAILLDKIKDYKITKGFNCGRKRQISEEYYLKWILFVLISGVPWEDLKNIKDELRCKPESIKQQFYRWQEQHIFDDVHNELLGFYVKNNDINITYIDSSDIQNRNGLKTATAFNIKYKGKRALRIHSLCDENKITHSFAITTAKVKDDQMIEEVIENIEIPLEQTYRNPLYVAGDKGYIHEKVRKILKKQNIILSYPYKKNQKRRNGTKKRKILKRRYLIENCYNQIKKGYKRTNQLYDRNIKTYLTFLKMANTCQIIKCPKFHTQYINYLKKDNSKL